MHLHVSETIYKRRFPNGKNKMNMHTSGSLIFKVRL